MITINSIKESDYQEIIQLWNNQPGIGIHHIDDSYDGFLVFLHRNPQTCFVIKSQNKIIGTLLAGYDGRRVTLYHVMIDEAYQGQGIARRLVLHTIKQLRKLKITKVNLVVYKDNQLGNAFWEKMNFKIRDDLYYRDLIL